MKNQAFCTLNLLSILKFHYLSEQPFLKIAFFLLSFCVFGTTTAQSTIRGTILDETANPLPFAAVSLLHLPDSTIFVQGQTNDEGNFRFSSENQNERFLLQINYVGYEFFSREILATGSRFDTLDIGNLKLTPLSKLLDEAVITASREAVQIKGDTMAFDAKSFQTQPNAMAGDLIKKLPGMELEKDGTVKAQGEDVQQILVNGKLFLAAMYKLHCKICLLMRLNR